MVILTASEERFAQLLIKYFGREGAWDYDTQKEAYLCTVISCGKTLMTMKELDEKGAAKFWEIVDRHRAMHVIRELRDLNA